MTARPDGGDSGWTGFVLAVVPVVGIALDGPALVRLVTDRIRADVVLADSVQLAPGPAVDGPGQAFEVANTLVQAAQGERRRLFAPQAVFGCVLVGRDAQEAALVADALARTRHLNRLPVYFYGVAATDLETTADEVIGKVFAMMESYERWPDFVLDGLAYRALLRPAPTPATAPAPTPAPTPAAPMPTAAAAPVPTAAPAAPVPTAAGTAVGGWQEVSPEAAPLPEAPGHHAPDAPIYRPPAGPPPVTPSHPDQGLSAQHAPAPPPAHTSVHAPQAPSSRAPDVPVDRPRARPRWQPPAPAAPARWSRWREALRLPHRAPQPTQADALHRLERTTYAVDLVYFVLVTDSERVDRSTRQRRERLLLDLDAAYATPPPGPHGEEPPPVEVALYTAGRSLVRHGPLQPAGQLADTRLPKVELDYVDLVECVGAVQDAYQRECTALNRRGIEVPVASVLFVATSAPLADSDTVDRIRSLCEDCRVAWILLGADARLVSEEFTEAGALVLEDHPDLVSELVERRFLG